MWIHFGIFGVILLLGLFYESKSKVNRKLYMVSIFMIFFILSTFRSVNIGNDTREYFRVFKLICSSNSLSSAIELTRYEVGFVTLNYVISRVTTNFAVLLGAVTVFYLFSILRFVKKYASSVTTVVTLCFTLFMFYDVMNIVRQCISVAIFLFAIDFLIERKPVKYIFLIILATLFHNMSVVLIFLYFLPKIDFKKVRNLVKWIFICAIALVLLNYMGQITYYISPYFSHYFNTKYAEGGIRIASILFFGGRITIVLFVWIIGGLKKSDSANKKTNVLTQLMLLDCIVASMSISFNMLDRLEGFFCLGYIIMISNAICTLKKDNRIVANAIIITGTFIYMTVLLIYRSNWYGLFPYQFG